MNKQKLLIVDDEPHILSSLKRVLENENREVHLAGNAEEAWAILQEKGEVEVVVCDNRLPGMLGLDFLTKLKRLYPDTIRILITGYPDLNSAMGAINKAHIWRYVLKPIEVEELRTLVNQAFDYYRILRENRLLLQIARQQSEWIKVLKDKHPQIVMKDLEQGTTYVVEEKRVSEILDDFVKRYYDADSQENDRPADTENK